MGDPDSAEQTFDLAESRMRGIRRVWKWGIGFWILAWVYSALVVLIGISIHFAGIEVRLGLSSGSIYMGFGDSYYASSAGRIILESPEFGFSEYNEGWYYMDCPERIIGRLGHTRWLYIDDEDNIAFPMAGVLWLWLLLGWTDGFKKFQWLKSFRSPRTLARIFGLLCLASLIGYSEYSGQKKDKIIEEMEVCVMRMRNINQAVRGHQNMMSLDSGSPLDLNDIFGPEGYLEPKESKCPSGLPYRFSKFFPLNREFPAECPNHDHLEKFKLWNDRSNRIY
jgi:hypothetical protein